MSDIDTTNAVTYLTPSPSAVEDGNTDTLHGKLRGFLDTAKATITTQQIERDTADLDITAQAAARDAAQAIIDNVASTTAQKNAARTDKEFALVRLAAARHVKQSAVLHLDVLRAEVALLRLVIGSDLLLDTDGT